MIEKSKTGIVKIKLINFPLENKSTQLETLNPLKKDEIKKVQFVTQPQESISNKESNIFDSIDINCEAFKCRHELDCKYEYYVRKGIISLEQKRHFLSKLFGFENYDIYKEYSKWYKKQQKAKKRGFESWEEYKEKGFPKRKLDPGEEQIMNIKNAYIECQIQRIDDELNRLVKWGNYGKKHKM